MNWFLLLYEPGLSVYKKEGKRKSINSVYPIADHGGNDQQYVNSLP